MLLGAAGGASDPVRPLKVFTGNAVAAVPSERHFIDLKDPPGGVADAHQAD